MSEIFPTIFLEKFTIHLYFKLFDYFWKNFRNIFYSVRFLSLIDNCLFVQQIKVAFLGKNRVLHSNAHHFRKNEYFFIISGTSLGNLINIYQEKFCDKILILENFQRESCFLPIKNLHNYRQIYFRAFSLISQLFLFA